MINFAGKKIHRQPFPSAVRHRNCIVPLRSCFEIFANNHRTRCHLSPGGWLDTCGPSRAQFEDIHLLEKVSTKEGWSQAAPNGHFTMGDQAELQDFVFWAATGRKPQSDLDLALDTTAVIYAAYLSTKSTAPR
jgi:hypothetical protein